MSFVQRFHCLPIIVNALFLIIIGCAKDNSRFCFQDIVDPSFIEQLQGVLNGLCQNSNGDCSKLECREAVASVSYIVCDCMCVYVIVSFQTTLLLQLHNLHFRRYSQASYNYINRNQEPLLLSAGYIIIYL